MTPFYTTHAMCISKILTDSSDKVLQKHKENCLIVYGKKTVKLKSGSIEFKNYFKQLAGPFKIYADFESLLKGVKVMIKIITLHT